jgi:hypothetical protein
MLMASVRANLPMLVRGIAAIFSVLVAVGIFGNGQLLRLLEHHALLVGNRYASKFQNRHEPRTTVSRSGRASTPTIRRFHGNVGRPIRCRMPSGRICAWNAFQRWMCSSVCQEFGFSDCRSQTSRVMLLFGLIPTDRSAEQG